MCKSPSFFFCFLISVFIAASTRARASVLLCTSWKYHVKPCRSLTDPSHGLEVLLFFSFHRRALHRILPKLECIHSYGRHGPASVLAVSSFMHIIFAVYFGQLIVLLSVVIAVAIGITDAALSDVDGMMRGLLNLILVSREKTLHLHCLLSRKQTPTGRSYSAWNLKLLKLVFG